MLTRRTIHVMAVAVAMVVVVGTMVVTAATTNSGDTGSSGSSSSSDSWKWLFSDPDVAALGPVKARVGTSSDRATASSDVYSTASNIRAGLYATTALAAGDTIASVPTDRLFHPSRLHDPAMNAFLNYTSENSFLLDQRVVCAVGLLSQYLKFITKQHIFGAADSANAAAARHATIWDSYFASLPAVPSSVLFYDSYELSELQLPDESPLFTAREQQLEYITEMYKFVSSVFKTQPTPQAEPQHPSFVSLFPKDSFTEKWFAWAYATVMNRGIELPLIPWSAADSSLVVLAPFIDQINHSNPPHNNAVLELVRGTDRTKSHLRLVANRPIPAGAQITASYASFFPLETPPAANSAAAAGAGDSGAVGSGAGGEAVSSASAAADATRSVVSFPVHGYSNTQLLVHFGLALPINEFEHISLDIGFDETVAADDPLYQTKDRVLSLNSLARQCLVSVDGVLPASFVHALRVKQLTRDDLRRLSYYNYQFLPENGFFSLQNELRVQLQLLASVEELLRGYSTTLNRDMTIATGIARFVDSSQQQQPPSQSQQPQQQHSNLPQVVNYRMSVKRVLHVLILRSLSSLSELFSNLTNRWSDDLATAMTKLSPTADAAAAATTAADAATSTAVGEIAIDAQPPVIEFLHRTVPDALPTPNTASSASDRELAFAEWTKWQARLKEWQTAIQSWNTEHRGWIKQAIGLDSLPAARLSAGSPTPAPPKPMAGATAGATVGATN